MPIPRLTHWISAVLIATVAAVSGVSQPAKSTRTDARQLVVSAAPLAYWPLSHGPDAATGGQPMRPGAAVVLGSGRLPGFDLPLWGEADLGSGITGALLPAGTEGYMGARLPTGAYGDGWAIEYIRSGSGGQCWFYVVEGGAASRTAWIWSADAEKRELTLSLGTESADSPSVRTLGVFPMSRLFDAGLHHVRMRVAPSDGDAVWTVSVDGETVGTGRVNGQPAPQPQFLGIGWANHAYQGSIGIARVAAWDSPLAVEAAAVLR